MEKGRWCKARYLDHVKQDVVLFAEDKGTQVGPTVNQHIRELPHAVVHHDA